MMYYHHSLPGQSSSLYDTSAGVLSLYYVVAALLVAIERLATHAPVSTCGQPSGTEGQNVLPPRYSRSI